MKSFRELFEQYNKAILPDDKVEGLNQELMELYFNSPEDLNQEELEYTEDLAFELYATNNLDEIHSNKLKEKFEKDPSLQRKYTLLRNINEGSQTAKEKRLRLAFDSETEEKEEAELKEVLEEVIEKVHADAKQPQTDSSFEIIVAKITAFFRDLIPTGIFYQPQLSSDRRQMIFQPQVKLVMVLASVLLITVVVWITVSPLNKNQIANNDNEDSLNIIYANTDSLKLQEDDFDNQIVDAEIVDSAQNIQIADIDKQEQKEDLLELAKRERIKDQYAANYKKPKFEVYDVRSQTSYASDLFVRASENYEKEVFDSCIYILNNLLSGHYFKSADTLNEIHFFLANSYLAKGLKKNEKELIELSLNSFKDVDAIFFQDDVKWYSAIALFHLNRDEESLKLIEELVQRDYRENIEVFRDSLIILMQN